LCPEHQQSFIDILGDVPDRLATMGITIAKQAVTAGQGGSPKNDDDRPIPIDLGASEANTILRATFVTLTVRVQHCLGEQPRDQSMRGCAAWLLKLMPRIAAHPESVQWYGDLAKAYARTTKAIDLPPERVRAGRCSCNAVLYTVAGRETVQCKPCGLRYNVADMQAAEIGRVRDYQDTAMTVIRVLGLAGIKIKRKRLENWAARGQLTTTEDHRGKIYTVGHVYDLYNQMEGVQ
jgi:hypothetical protein